MRASKRFELGAVVIGIALVATSIASAGSALPGTYTTKIASPAQFRGTWDLTFTGSGTYTVVDSGKVLVRGRYTAAGSRITLAHEKGQGACAATGVYRWTRAGTTLRFARTSDSATCVGRRGVLAHTFTRTG